MTMLTAQATRDFIETHEEAGARYVRSLLARFRVHTPLDIHAADETKYLEQLEGYDAPLPQSPQSPPRDANVVGVKKLRGGAQLPVFMSNGAAGADLHACLREGGAFTLRATERVLVPTGIAVEIPAGYEGQIRPRSGIAREKGATVLNAPGTIDSDYRGEIHVLLINHGPTYFRINHGDRIAQLVIAPVTRPTFVWTGGVLAETARGEKGFGSTGV